MTEKDYNNCVEVYSDGVYRFILKSIKDDDKASDIVQDAFEKLWRMHDGIIAEKCKSYLFTTAYHLMLNTIRHEKFQVSFDDIQHNDRIYEDGYSDLKEILDAAIEKLPEIQKNVLLLRDYEDYSYQEIGEITGLTESQVKVYIYRARLFLKNYIGKIETVI